MHTFVCGMRWTNYFIHPGDNRYYVFSFRETAHAEESDAQSGGLEGSHHSSAETNFGAGEAQDHVLPNRSTHLQNFATPTTFVSDGESSDADSFEGFLSKIPAI